jgi:uncharacterized membrane protein YccC
MIELVGAGLIGAVVGMVILFLVLRLVPLGLKKRSHSELDMTKMFNELCHQLFRTYPSGWDYEQFRARIVTKLYKLYGEEKE